MIYWWLDAKDIDGLMQERGNSIANALELRLAQTHRYVTHSTNIYVYICRVSDDNTRTDILSHWLRGKMAGIPQQTTFSNV